MWSFECSIKEHKMNVERALKWLWSHTSKSQMVWRYMGGSRMTHKRIPTKFVGYIGFANLQHRQSNQLYAFYCQWPNLNITSARLGPPRWWQVNARAFASRYLVPALILVLRVTINRYITSIVTTLAFARKAHMRTSMYIWREKKKVFTMIIIKNHKSSQGNINV